MGRFSLIDESGRSGYLPTMPRTATVAPKEHIYHILTRGNNRQDVFEDEENNRRYLDILLRYKEKYHFNLYHYVLMTNHVHLVIEPLEGGGKLI